MKSYPEYFQDSIDMTDGSAVIYEKDYIAIQSDARKDLEQDIAIRDQQYKEAFGAWKQERDQLRQAAIDYKSAFEKTARERDQLLQELQAAKCAPPKSFLSAPDSIIMKCGHNSYWKTHYENCMACRAEKAEQQVEAQSNLVCNIQDTCRARGFMQRPVDEAVIAMAQDRDKLAAQVARLRDAVDHRKSFGRQLEGSDASRAAQEALYSALSIAPPDALKEVRLEVLRYAVGIVDGRRVLNRSAAYVAALNEIKIFLDASIERVSNGDSMHATAITQYGHE